MERSEIMDKIRKLLALSKSPNEHEATLAASKAQEFMAKHGIFVLEAEVAKGQVSEHTTKITRDSAEWMRRLFAGIAKVNDLETYFWTKTKRLVAMGLPADIEVCDYLFNYLRRAIQDLAIEKERAGRWQVEQRRNYCRGAVDRVVDRLKEMKVEREQADVACRALVIKKESLIHNHLVQKGYRSRNFTVKQEAFDASFYARGFADGGQVPIHRAVNR